MRSSSYGCAPYPGGTGAIASGRSNWADMARHGARAHRPHRQKHRKHVARGRHGASRVVHRGPLKFRPPSRGERKACRPVIHRLTARRRSSPSSIASVPGPRAPGGGLKESAAMSAWRGCPGTSDERLREGRAQVIMTDAGRAAASQEPPQRSVTPSKTSTRPARTRIAGAAAAIAAKPLPNAVLPSAVRPMPEPTAAARLLLPPRLCSAVSSPRTFASRALSLAAETFVSIQPARRERRGSPAAYFREWHRRQSEACAAPWQCQSPVGGRPRIGLWAYEGHNPSLSLRVQRGLLQGEKRYYFWNVTFHTRGYGLCRWAGRWSASARGSQ